LNNKDNDFAAYEVIAKLYHAYFLGLQLMVSSRMGPKVVGDWMFRLFRQQHEDKFLSSFTKLGLAGLPDAVACARYHVLSNRVGGVPVEYLYESDRKAWVRFRYPRWMFQGPTLCGVPQEASQGFLEGWYAHNGVSLNNPRLGFVCISEDMTGEFGLCGYFYEYDDVLAPHERLRFARDERPPDFASGEHLEPPSSQWNAERLAKANRNYAVEYVRNGIGKLLEVVGDDDAQEMIKRSAKLIGLQYASEIAQDLNCSVLSTEDLVELMAQLMTAAGDEVVVNTDATLTQRGLRVARGLSGSWRDSVLAAWGELFAGIGMAQLHLYDVSVTFGDTEGTWKISSFQQAPGVRF